MDKIVRPPESVHDFLQQRNSTLDVFFEPKTVALIGATETVGSVGRTILKNLIASPFGGTVYPVNPKHRSILGHAAYPSIAEAPGPIDLAIIVTPAPVVPTWRRAHRTSASTWRRERLLRLDAAYLTTPWIKGTTSRPPGCNAHRQLGLGA